MSPELMGRRGGVDVPTAAVARAFDLGVPAAPPRRLPGLSEATVYRLMTDRGDFVIKIVEGDLVELSLRSALERAAREAGVATPPPVEPVTPTAGYWTTVEGQHVRVSVAVHGEAPELPADGTLAGWLGRTVATIADLPVAVAPAAAPSYPAWRDRLGSYAPLAPVLDELAALVATAWLRPPPLVPGHRDINARNILLTEHGPLLLDFDHSGPIPAWWELVHQGFLLACHDLGAEDPAEATVRTAVAAYAEAGGPIGPADPLAFAGLVAGLLSWVDENAALGNARALARASVCLPAVAKSLNRWAGLLS